MRASVERFQRIDGDHRRARAGLVLVAAAALVTVALSGGPSPHAQVRDGRFGVVEPHDAPALASELGIGWGRVRFNWALVQPNSADEWVEAEITDAELANELASGREVVGLLIGIPSWAVDERGLPRGLYSPPDSPENTWGNFVRLAVSRHRGRINHWIIWNEPDVWDPAHPGYTWPGSEADFVQLLRVAYLVANQENPDSVIHLGAMSHWWDALYGRELYLRRFLRALTADPGAAANNYYYDVLTLHLYFHPAGIYDLIETYAAIQWEFGIDKPIWLVETNAAPSGDPAWPVPSPTFRVSLQEQAAFMPQTLALALAAGAQRVGIYKLIDTPGDYAANPEPFGLVRMDGSLRPAFTTAQVAIARLAGAQRANWVDRGAVSRVVVEGDGWVTHVLWMRLPATQVVLVPAQTNQATLYDMWGASVTVYPTDGYYRVELVGGECQQTTGDYCMIGGPTFYLVEDVESGSAWTPSEVTTVSAEASAPPESPEATEMADLATATSAPTLPATPTLTLTSTPTPTSTLTPLPTATATCTASPEPTSTSTSEPQPSLTPTQMASPMSGVGGAAGFGVALVVLIGTTIGIVIGWVRRRGRSSQPKEA